MLGLGMGEILMIALVILVFVGPDRLPKFMRQAGKLYGQMRRAADDMRRSLVLEADRQDADERYERLQERRRQAEEARKKAVESTPESVPQAPKLAAVPSPAPDEPAPSAAPALHPEPLPPGISREEFDALPDHIQALLQRRSSG